MKIHQLEIENVKRVKAVKIMPAQNGLTIIGGKNGQGKTSVLDALAWVLGGDRFRPSAARGQYAAAQHPHSDEQRACGGAQGQEQRPEGD